VLALTESVLALAGLGGSSGKSERVSGSRPHSGGVCWSSFVVVTSFVLVAGCAGEPWRGVPRRALRQGVDSCEHGPLERAQSPPLGVAEVARELELEVGQVVERPLRPEQALLEAGREPAPGRGRRLEERPRRREQRGAPAAVRLDAERAHEREPLADAQPFALDRGGDGDLLVEGQPHERVGQARPEPSRVDPARDRLREAVGQREPAVDPHRLPAERLADRLRAEPFGAQRVDDARLVENRDGPARGVRDQE
jgi:hypothetical protein